MVNNFKHIFNLEFVQEALKDNNLYFHVQILKRKKDDEEMDKNNKLIRSYSVFGDKILEHFESSVIKQCEFFKARAYINLAPKSKERTACLMMSKLAECFNKRDFNTISHLWDSAAGSVHAEKGVWIIDCDYSETLNDSKIEEMITFINKNCQPLEDKVITCIPTKNGKHIITKPFDVRPFKLQFGEIDIHKNNPTVLYIPESID